MCEWVSGGGMEGGCMGGEGELEGALRVGVGV